MGKNSLRSGIPVHNYCTVNIRMDLTKITKCCGITYPEILKTSLLRRLQAQSLSDATPPIGIINQFRKIAVTFEPSIKF